MKTSLDTQQFNLKVGFYDEANSQRSSMLQFMLAVYHMNGTFMGYTEMQAHLSQCPLQFKDVLTIKKFGSVTVNKCSLVLNDLLQKETLPSQANLFFELFLLDGAGNFIDVPVLVRNLRTKNAAGQV